VRDRGIGWRVCFYRYVDIECVEEWVSFMMITRRGIGQFDPSQVPAYLLDAVPNNPCPGMTEQPGACASTQAMLQAAANGLGYTDVQDYIDYLTYVYTQEGYCASWIAQQVACVQSVWSGGQPTVSASAIDAPYLAEYNAAAQYDAANTVNVPTLTSAVAGNTNSQTSAVAQTNSPVNTTNTTMASSDGTATGVTGNVLTEDSLGLGLSNWEYAAIAAVGLFLVMGKK
jgi:hypothetical protein